MLWQDPSGFPLEEEQERWRQDRETREEAKGHGLNIPQGGDRYSNGRRIRTLEMSGPGWVGRGGKFRGRSLSQFPTEPQFPPQ